MKRILLGLGLVVLLVVVAFGGMIGWALHGLLPITDRLEIVPGIRIVKDGTVSVGVIDNGDGHATLIDCGDDPEAKALLADLQSQGISPDGVRLILLTHGHKDHTGGCAKFPHATIAALEADVALVEGRAGSHGPITRLMPVKPTGLKVGHVLHDNDPVEVGHRIGHVFAVPGHTAGSAAYLIDGVLFIGDSAAVTSTHHLRAAPWAFSDDSKQNVAWLHTLAARLGQEHVVAIAPSHTGVLRDDIVGELANAD